MKFNGLFLALLTLSAGSLLVQAQEAPSSLRGSDVETMSPGAQRRANRKGPKKNMWYLTRRLLPRMLSTCTPAEEFQAVQSMSGDIVQDTISLSTNVLQMAPTKDAADIAAEFVDYMDDVVDEFVEAIGECWAAEVVVYGTALAFLHNDIATAMNMADSMSLEDQGIAVVDVMGESLKATSSMQEGAKYLLDYVSRKGIDGFVSSHQREQASVLLVVLKKFRNAMKIMRDAVSNVGGDWSDWELLRQGLSNLISDVKLIRDKKY